jgi:SAM-dependent methyltransferase
VKAYYPARAAEYDDVWLGRGRYARRRRLGWDREVAELSRFVAGLPPASTLDVACGTGFLTQHLHGEVVGLDQSEAMLDIARRRLKQARLLRGDALSLPFANRAFARVFTSFFYGHLDECARRRFVSEGRRVAPELIVVEGTLRSDLPPARTEERCLSDGSRWLVYTRYFTGEGLAGELGGGTVLFDGDWFVAAPCTARRGFRAAVPPSGNGRRRSENAAPKWT